MRVLLIEDERLLSKAIAEILRANNYSVDCAYEGERALYLALSDVYDILILDLLLPRKDGLTVLKELRGAGSEVPVLILTALGQTSDIVKGLNVGADDYLVKPFHAEELLARLRALVRRQPVFNESGFIKCGDITFSPHDLTLSHAEESITLSLKQSQLFELLAANINQIVSKSRIGEKLWGFDTALGDSLDNRIETQVSLLRHKLADLNSSIHIKTIRNLGYVLTAPDQSTEQE